MADWDAESPRLAENLRRVLREARDHAEARQLPTAEEARRWHMGMMGGLDVPLAGDASWLARILRTPGLKGGAGFAYAAGVKTVSPAPSDAALETGRIREPRLFQDLGSGQTHQNQRSRPFSL